ncbi:tRNA-I(6)A37 thiotransferase enzyme MiaB [Basidiobolus meristosporus CBS 931.73]|uniref:tRNA-I(6)A37 thiotransferase enzyme MiaB n=1 Tax=Basidiobolus meristosporus CBS 931.73 TaxID=1314790 RepID=A0A1Y1Y3A3_9FUNG|nr:tRNA-I(6)A37 thiotransferase enzyme MiaB [Basidiobolus meristosporus CBS 931.73]|eukprot:ORX92501.1 tRNA-I(6)A37 thiotransferase enzyme MiaB [Basidiobolus meristosporus CBS 931.73]
MSFLPKHHRPLGKLARYARYTGAEAFSNPRCTKVVGASSPVTLRAHSTEAQPKKKILVFDNKSPNLQDFIRASSNQLSGATVNIPQPEAVPYLPQVNYGAGSKYFIEVYGCQMNVNDTEILMGILNQAGYSRTHELEDADVIFLVTCSIRENAENKIYQRLNYFKHLKTKKRPTRPPLVGVLGCMAERLKGKLLEQEKVVDIVCGPDAYRSIPHLISMAETSIQQVANVILSADETYADIMPVRLNDNSVSVHLSIMRGCNNMCSYCIVPFTRGTERSRPIDSIVDEVRKLSDQGIKEVILLGQNVNSYRDTSESKIFATSTIGQDLSRGFKTIYKRKEGGRRFAELIDRVSEIDPEMRIRFTSPHPKDFPDDLLWLIKEKPNVCSNIHMPAQSGNTEVLDRMRRGYSREAYLDLVSRIRGVIPGVTLSSDFITGFCHETEEEHRDTVTLMEQVKYDMAYMFAYSMREKTHAHRKMIDDVPDDVKSRRLQEIIETFHRNAREKNQALIGKPQLVLVEGTTKRNANMLQGRDDGNHKVFIEIPAGQDMNIKPGDYVKVITQAASATSLSALAVEKTTLAEYARQHPTAN